MSYAFLEERFRSADGDPALIWNERTFSFAWLLEEIGRLSEHLAAQGVRAGSVVAFPAPFRPETVATFFALLRMRAIGMPLAGRALEPFLEIGRAGFRVEPGKERGLSEVRLEPEGSHPLYDELRRRGEAGLVLFTSGSSGEPKGAVHDCSRLLAKYRRERRSLRTLAFLLFDHIGGVDTLLYTLSNRACLVLVEDRRPERICEAIERHGVEVLPVTPSFLNLLSAGEAYRDYRLSSLRYVTYGAELMPAGTLVRCREMFPLAALLQKYGTTEVGTLRSRSQSSDSLWVQIGGEGYSTRVVEGILQIRADSSMLGYLNAPSPFGEDGWFDTGDRVEERDGYYRFLGKASDFINVGGKKVDPVRVESVIRSVPGVVDALVSRQENPFLGQIVTAQIQVQENRDEEAFLKEVKCVCRERLEPHEVPVRVECRLGNLATERQKKIRRKPGNTPS